VYNGGRPHSGAAGGVGGPAGVPGAGGATGAGRLGAPTTRSTIRLWPS
jgi:hypothetical protein